eukprot:TRINITY_DN7651_c0_g1_i1.p1 TRINITY_DN7651_c0_g1~~TRINITY_DN7651_c0_g1_i1.p1  ORF type:complete len:710 (-),score=120.67 TRINITY_DN7651_c0_g1_i1:107-2236(-)
MIEYSERWTCSVLCFPSSVCLRSSIFAFVAGIFTVGVMFLDEASPDLRSTLGIMDISESQIWTALCASLAVVLCLRTSRAMSRFWEGTTLLHQMRAEWLDSISCSVTFSRKALRERPEKVHIFRQTIVRLTSFLHACALHQLSPGLDTKTLDSTGLDKNTLRHLHTCKEVHNFKLVEVTLHMIQALITRAHEESVLDVPPPMLSGVFRTLSMGYVHFLNCRKITDTPLPFAYAQLIIMLLFSMLVMTPLLMSCVISNKVIAFCVTFLVTFGMFAVNFVAIRLENPFAENADDLPLHGFQCDMNSSLLMLLEKNVDHVAGLSVERFFKSFDEMKLILSDSEARPSFMSNALEVGAALQKASVDVGSEDGKQDLTEFTELPWKQGSVRHKDNHEFEESTRATADHVLLKAPPEEKASDSAVVEDQMVKTMEEEPKIRELGLSVEAHGSRLYGSRGRNVVYDGGIAFEMPETAKPSSDRFLTESSREIKESSRTSSDRIMMESSREIKESSRTSSDRILTESSREIKESSRTSSDRILTESSREIKELAKPPSDRLLMESSKDMKEIGRPPSERMLMDSSRETKVMTPFATRSHDSSPCQPLQDTFKKPKVYVLHGSPADEKAPFQTVDGFVVADRDPYPTLFDNHNLVYEETMVQPMSSTATRPGDMLRLLGKTEPTIKPALHRPRGRSPPQQWWQHEVRKVSLPPQTRLI